MLAEEPDREIVIGAYAQPWHERVTFHPLPPDEFVGFDQPGYVKIVWTLGAEPLGPNDSLLITRTRAVATDPQSRKRFRRYWGPMSAGIILIRYAGLPLMRKEAERRAAAAGQERQHRLRSDRGGVVIEHAVDIRRSPDEVSITAPICVASPSGIPGPGGSRRSPMGPSGSGLAIRGSGSGATP